MMTRFQKLDRQLGTYNGLAQWTVKPTPHPLVKPWQTMVFIMMGIIFKLQQKFWRNEA